MMEIIGNILVFEHELPPIARAVSIMCLKHLYGVALALMLFGIIYRYSEFLSSFFNHAAFRISCRINMATFLCNWFISMYLASHVRSESLHDPKNMVNSMTSIFIEVLSSSISVVQYIVKYSYELFGWADSHVVH
jgi:hypothetical protein